VEGNDAGEAALIRLPGAGAGARPAAGNPAADAVGALYQESGASLIRLAYVILSDRQAAEDVVQDAFFSLYRRWDQLADRDRIRQYLRTSVLNACRSVLRHRKARSQHVLYELPAPSVEAAVLGSEERDDVIRAVDQLPARMREALVLRYYLDLPDEEIARLMRVRNGTVRSTMHRALATLSRILREGS